MINMYKYFDFVNLVFTFILHFIFLLVNSKKAHSDFYLTQQKQASVGAPSYNYAYPSDSWVCSSSSLSTRDRPAASELQSAVLPSLPSVTTVPSSDAPSHDAGLHFPPQPFPVLHTLSAVRYTRCGSMPSCRFSPTVALAGRSRFRGMADP